MSLFITLITHAVAMSIFAVPHAKPLHQVLS